MKLDKVVKRYFTKDLESESRPRQKSVYDMFKWKSVDVEIKSQTTGETLFEMKNCMFPEHYSQTACEIIASKYFYRNIDGKGATETSLRQVVHRMAAFWTSALIDEGLLKDDGMGIEEYCFHKEVESNCYNFFTAEAEIFYDELVYALLSQMWSPNSPQWFNTGICCYGIEGDADDLYYYDPDLGRSVLSPDRYSKTQASACFILDIKDQLLGPGSISDHYVNETKLFKGGSGVGTNFSPLRAEGEHLSSGGTSSGLMSYLEGLDRNAGAIKSGGTTRRAAKMVIVDVDHPEIKEFVGWKAHEEKKAKVLMKAGYDGSIGGEAYNTVSGQNSNNSVRVNAEFMKKLKEPGSTIELTGRVDDCVNKTVGVSELWDLIARAAWECGDPAIQFDDIYNEWNTCSNSGRINATNPCSEYAFLDNTACNLASINVYKFWDNEKSVFDVEGYKHLIGIIQMVLEASIEGGQFPTPEVAENSYKFRTTGLGLANLASLFLSLGVPYDSDEARSIAAALCSLMTGWSYVVSAGMAKKIGPFEKWAENSEPMKRVIQKHRSFADESQLPPFGPMADVWVAQWEAWSYAETAADYGFRNAQVSVMAPTGTISLAMDCGSTGIEPFYSHLLYKKCADGSFITVRNPLAEFYIHSVSGCDATEYSVNQYFNGNGTYRGCPDLKEEEQAVLATAMEISPEGHVKMMAAVQPFISGSISKTVNLPNSATPDDIKRVYELAYETGCKSIAIYRDGSKGTQPLADKQSGEPEIESEHSKDESETKIESEDLKTKSPYAPIVDRFEKEHPGIYPGIKQRQRGEWQTYVHGDFLNYMCEYDRKPKKPDGIRDSRTHSAKMGDVELYITVGYYPDGRMAELFVSTDRDGTVVKGLLTCLSKAVSHLLQNHVKPQEISKMLRGQKFEPYGPVSRHPNIKFAESIADLISKVIDIECGDYSRCQIKPETIYLGDVPLSEKPASFTLSHRLNDAERIYGERCPECGSDRLIKSGTCKTCLVCGATTGCS